MTDTPSDPDQLLAMMPYAAALGVELHDTTPTLVTGSLAWSSQRCTAGGILHGGAIMSLADTVGAVCAFLNLPQGATTATIDSTTRLYRPLRTGTLHATARPVHTGRTTIVVTTDLTDDQQRLVAQTSQAQAVIAQAGPPRMLSLRRLGRGTPAPDPELHSSASPRRRPAVSMLMSLFLPGVGLRGVRLLPIEGPGPWRRGRHLGTGACRIGAGVLGQQTYDAERG